MQEVANRQGYLVFPTLVLNQQGVFDTMQNQIFCAGQVRCMLCAKNSDCCSLCAACLANNGDSAIDWRVGFFRSCFFALTLLLAAQRRFAGNPFDQPVRRTARSCFDLFAHHFAAICRISSRAPTTLWTRSCSKHSPRTRQSSGSCSRKSTSLSLSLSFPKFAA